MSANCAWLLLLITLTVLGILHAEPEIDLDRFFKESAIIRSYL